MRAIAFLTAAALLLAACASPTTTTPAAPIPPAAPGLIISEVTNAGAPYNGIAVEVYNPTNAALDLGTYQLRTSSRASFNPLTGYGTQLSGTGTFDLASLSIAPQGYAVIRSRVMKDYVSGGATVYVDDGSASQAGYPWVDPTFGTVELLQGGGTADFVRWGSGNTTIPTSSGFAFQGSASAIAAATQSTTYAGYAWTRDVNETNTKNSSDWTVRAWSTLGGPNDITSDTSSDNDGIPDQAKISGNTFAGLDLYGWGARPGHRDIFIHIDYQDSTDPGVIPQKAALDKLVAAFAADPVAPIYLHLDVGNLFSATVDPTQYNLDGRSHKITPSNGGSIALGASIGHDNVYQYKTASMPVAKSKVFFYMVFADSQLLPAANGSSGIANLPGNTSIITLGHWGLNNSTTAMTNYLVNYQAATMMHEFGHNLGLRHGGDVNDNFKPNYFSVMNYLYQLDGLPSSGHEDTRYYAAYADHWGDPSSAGQVKLNSTWTTQADRSLWTDSAATTNFAFSYSNGTSGDLDESAPVESQGIRRAGSAGIDFTNDGDAADSVPFSYNSTNYPIRYMLDPNFNDNAFRVLKDYNDWAAINSVFQRNYQGTWSGVGPRTVSAPTVSQLFVESAPTTSEPCLNPFATRSANKVPR